MCNSFPINRRTGTWEKGTAVSKKSAVVLITEWGFFAFGFPIGGPRHLGAGDDRRSSLTEAVGRDPPNILDLCFRETLDLISFELDDCLLRSPYLRAKGFLVDSISLLWRLINGEDTRLANVFSGFNLWTTFLWKFFSLNFFWNVLFPQIRIRLIFSSFLLFDPHETCLEEYGYSILYPELVCLGASY